MDGSGWGKKLSNHLHLSNNGPYTPHQWIGESTGWRSDDGCIFIMRLNTASGGSTRNLNDSLKLFPLTWVTCSLVQTSWLQWGLSTGSYETLQTFFFFFLSLFFYIHIAAACHSITGHWPLLLFLSSLGGWECGLWTNIALHLTKAPHQATKPASDWEFLALCFTLYNVNDLQYHASFLQYSTVWKLEE